MIYLPVTSTDVYHNFALEYYLMSEKHFKEPVFMLWSTTPTVMLGKYQDAAAELNLDYIKKHGVHVVRRYSGGGTIYTDQGGYQFTLIYPDEHSEIDFSAGLTLIKAALNQIGIKAETDSRNDLVVAGRKVSGSAQYVTPGYKLHHGSLLFDSDLDTMAHALRVDPVKLKAKRIASVHQRTVNLKEQQPTWSASEFRERLLEAVLAAGQYQKYQLTDQDEDRISAIATQRFANPDFIYGQGNRFEHTGKRYFKGGGLAQISYTLSNHQLKDVRLSGDFFSNLDRDNFEAALIGAVFDQKTISRIIKNQLDIAPIMGISADQLTSLLFSSELN
ncbi:lipoate--protein ligase [Lentilactobacillus hilgardii]|uniref:lipoate--protein ligase n=1 Tax=Lentilactobacillus hilgardii TaxID=1588 RepID=UPI0039E7FFB5